MSGQSYFVAIILYQSTSDAPDYAPLYEESTVLVKAKTEAEARDKVLALTQSNAVQYLNEQGHLIQWRLDTIVDISPMLNDEIADVTEIYSRHFHDVEAYRAFEVLANQTRES